MSHQDVLYHELREVLDAGGCPLCRLGQAAADSYLNALIYEGVTDVGLRQELRDARGLCHRHAWRIARQRGSVLGVAIIYRDVVNALARAAGAEFASDTSQADHASSQPMEQTDPPLTPAARVHLRSSPFVGERIRRWVASLLPRHGDVQALVRGLAPSRGCPACRLEADAVRRGAKTLLKYLADPAIAPAFAAAGGLCLAHLQTTLDVASGPQAEQLRAWQTALWRQLRGELDELIRKHDYRFAGETITPSEATAWERAVAGVVGSDAPLARRKGHSRDDA